MAGTCKIVITLMSIKHELTLQGGCQGQPSRTDWQTLLAVWLQAIGLLKLA